MRDPAQLPPLSNAGHVLVVTAFWPPWMSGSSVLMHNLLRAFDPNSFTVVTSRVNAGPGLQRQCSYFRRLKVPWSLQFR